MFHNQAVTYKVVKLKNTRLSIVVLFEDFRTLETFIVNLDVKCLLTQRI